MSRKRGMVRARGLAAELKELREKSGLSTREAAARVGVSSATINRVENAGRSVEPAEVSALLVVPGLLQTQEYTRAVLACLGAPEREAELRVVVRAGRQVVLTRPRPPRFEAFIDEAALRRPMGGPRVMADQLRHIRRMTERPNVDVRVIPFDRGGHCGVISPFVLLEFAKADPIVHLEHLRSSALLDDPEDVAPYQAAKDKLAKVALGPAESSDFLARVSAEYDER